MTKKTKPTTLTQKSISNKPIYGSPQEPEPTDFIGKILYKAPMGAVIFYENFLIYAIHILAISFSIGCFLGGL